MASIETGAFQTEPLRQSSRPDADGPKPGYYSVSPGSPESAGADWMCAPAPLSTSRTSAVGAAPDETAAFPGGPGGSAILRRVPIGLLDDGHLAKVDRAGEVGIAWEEMFAALGVSSFEFRLYFKTGGETSDDVLAAAYSALTGDSSPSPSPPCSLKAFSETWSSSECAQDCSTARRFPA